MTRALAALLLAVSLAAPARAAGRLTTGLPLLDVAALAASRERLFVGSFDAGVYALERDGRARALQHPALNPNVNALAWSESERVLWVATARGLVRCHTEPSLDCVRLGSASPVHALLVRGDGGLVAGGDNGLTFVAPGSGASSTLERVMDAERSYGKKQGAPFRSVWAIAEGEAGNLFVGTTNGLFWGPAAAFSGRGARLSRAAFVTGALADDWVTALLRRDDRLYVGTYHHGIARFRIDGERLSGEGIEAMPGYVNAAGISALPDGGLAVATTDGLVRTAPPSAPATLEAHPGQIVRVTPPGRDVTALAASSDGGYWIATRTGLERIADLR